MIIIKANINVNRVDSAPKIVKNSFIAAYLLKI
jgi:hypothetical protein